MADHSDLGFEPSAQANAHADLGFTPDKVEPKGAVARFLDPLNPMHLVHALLKPGDDPKEDPRATFGRNVIGLVKDLGMAQVEQGKQALKSWNEGDHTSAVAH